MNNSRRVLLAAPFLLTLFACGGGGRSEADEGGTTTSATSLSATQGEASDESSSSGLPSTTDPDSSDSTGPGALCETIQCGDECCENDEECVLNECVEACESGVRCGDDLLTCCANGDVCLNPECVTPGEECIDSFDCPEGEFCEPTLGACLPQLDPVICEVEPNFEEVTVGLEWSFEEEQSISIPLVADIDGDDLPEVILSTWFHDDDNDGDEFDQGPAFGIIIVFDGRNGQEQFRIEQNPPAEYGSYGRTTAGIADVDGDGLPDIIYAGRPVSDPLNRSVIHAVNGVGTHLWSSHTLIGANHYLYVRNGAPSFANLDNDPESEIIWGGAIIDNDGFVVHDYNGNSDCSGPGTGQGCAGGEGSPLDYLGGIAAMADINGDGYPEMISGQRAFDIDWNDQGLFPQVSVTEIWDAGPEDGYPGIADFDLNGTPEVALVAGGQLRILDAATGELWCGADDTGDLCDGNDAFRTQPIDLPGGGRGGPPTVADFDGDGRPEVGIAGALAYTLFDFNRPNEVVVQPGGDPPPGPGDTFVRWTNDTLEDTFSQSTGSSVFDFQGDGTAEVLYSDTCHTRVFNGETGDTILELENTSATIHEYPIVVDVDADGNSEILVVANDRDFDNCEHIAGYEARRGIFVYGDPNDQWVRTRRVWTSHSYHVTNSDSRGLVPTSEINNWSTDGLNNYRQNVQGAGVFNAPDLAVDLAVGLSTCLDEEFQIVATVRNSGSLGVAAGVEVTLYEGMDDTGDVIGTQATAEPLLPGESVEIIWMVPAPTGQAKNFYVSVDDPGGAELVTECDESNNDAATETVSCGVPG